MKTIEVREKESGIVDIIYETNGYLLFYFEEDKIRSAGNIEIKALTPILTKLFLEKITK